MASLWLLEVLQDLGACCGRNGFEVLHRVRGGGSSFAVTFRLQNQPRWTSLQNVGMFVVAAAHACWPNSLKFVEIKYRQCPKCSVTG